LKNLVADAVPFEPVSTPKFLANREKNREFRRNHPLGPNSRAHTLAKSKTFREIPYATEQGNILAEEGIATGEQRIFPTKIKIGTG
jgi:hypothetical protein